jgi:hypothetical protein
MSAPSLGPCCVDGCAAEEEIRRLSGLLADPADANNVSGSEQKSLIHTFLAANRESAALYEADPLLKAQPELIRGGALLGCLFDLCTNLEYIARSKLATWAACNGNSHPTSVAALLAEDDEDEELLETGSGDPSLPDVQNSLETSLEGYGSLPAKNADSFEARLFFSFLRACPRCSYHWAHIPPVPNKPVTGNWSKRISVAGHKPTSGPIGDITSALMALLVQMVLRVNGSDLDAKHVTKQNHAIDLVLLSGKMLVAAETKASPLVTYPLSAVAPAGLVDHSDENALPDGAEVALYVPHRDWEIPLGVPADNPWPFSGLQAALSSDPTVAVRLVSAWFQLFLAYQVPKKLRRPRVQQLSYLTNGWGDNTDSNKTKAGLGRSDDMKKGTYQMLHFGTLLKDRCRKRAVLVALFANMDPVNMYAEYLEPLQDALWTVAEGVAEGSEVRFPADRVHRLYDGILTFNRMHPLDGPLAEPLSLEAFWRRALTSDGVDSVGVWSSASS